MKEKTKLQKVSVEMLELVKKADLTPTQLRYVNKRVREMGKFQIPKGKRKLPVYLTPAEIYHVRQVINDKFKPIDLFIFNFLLWTGLRVGEFVKLLVSDLDFSNNQLRVPQEGKTGERYVPFTPNCQSMVKIYLQGKPRGYVISKKNHKGYTERAIQKRMENIFAKAMLEKNLSTHSLRHTYATVLRANGVKIQDIQMYLGHADLKTTQIYAHLTYDMEQQKQIMQIMDNT